MPLRSPHPPPPERPRREKERDRRIGPRLTTGLRPLREIEDDFEVADGYPDIRGWMVTAASGTVVGSVRDLIVDPEAMLARHVQVELGPAGTDEGLGRDVLVPMSSVELDPSTDQVLTPGITVAQFAEMPPYSRALLDRDYDAGLLRRIGVRAVSEAVEAERPLESTAEREVARSTAPRPETSGAKGEADRLPGNDRLPGDDRVTGG